MGPVRIRVRGQVQGVGFRPFVWQLAQEMGIRGRVWNDPEGVRIEAEGDRIGDFAASLSTRAPALARVDAVEIADFVGDLPVGSRLWPAGAGGPKRGHARCRDLRRLRHRNRDAGAQAGLCLYKLHPLRSALQHPEWPPLRPGPDDDGRVSIVSRMSGRIRRPCRPSVSTPSRSPARSVDRDSGTR